MWNGGVVVSSLGEWWRVSAWEAAERSVGVARRWFMLDAGFEAVTLADPGGGKVPYEVREVGDGSVEVTSRLFTPGFERPWHRVSDPVFEGGLLSSFVVDGRRADDRVVPLGLSGCATAWAWAATPGVWGFGLEVLVVSVDAAHVLPPRPEHLGRKFGLLEGEVVVAGRARKVFAMVRPRRLRGGGFIARLVLSPNLDGSDDEPVELALIEGLTVRHSTGASEYADWLEFGGAQPWDIDPVVHPVSGAAVQERGEAGVDEEVSVGSGYSEADRERVWERLVACEQERTGDTELLLDLHPVPRRDLIDLAIEFLDMAPTNDPDDDTALQLALFEFWENH